jgi:hypothetical protein
MAALSAPRRSVRALVPAVLALALSTLTSLARADVDGGATDPTCTVAARAQSGETCATCDLSTGDTQCSDELGADYNFVCQYSATVQVWCNGPDRSATLTPTCAARASSSPSVGAASLLGALAVAGFLRRRARKA